MDKIKNEKAAGGVETIAAAEVKQKHSNTYNNHKKAHGGNSAHAQRQRLLARLRSGPLSTIGARRELDILMPAARVHELRHREGWEIQTLRREEETESGKKHNVALYVLQCGEVNHA